MDATGRYIGLHARRSDGQHGAVDLEASFDELGGTIGRGAGNHLVLPDPQREISRVAATVVYRSDGFYVVAVGSNPVSLNGRALQRDVEYRLRPGDRLQIGGYTLEVRSGSVAPAMPFTDPFADVLAAPPAAAPTLPADWNPFEAAPPPALTAPSPTPEDLFGLEPASAGAPSDPLADFAVPAPSVHADAVRLGAAAPRDVEPGQPFLVHFCAYPPGEEAAVRESLALQNPRAVALLSRRSCRWPPGTVVRVSLAAEDLGCDEPEQTLVWNSAAEILDFALRVPPAAPLGERIVAMRVRVGPLVVATLRLSVRVAPDARGAPQATAYGRAVGSGFASYSAHDRELVSHLVGAIEQSAGIDIFWDCLDLRPGEQWKPRLAREIAGREVFLLFWSRQARSSPWVEWEWRTALLTKGLPAIQVHALQHQVEPPPELAALHFGSVHTLVAEFERGRAQAGSS